MGIGSGKEHYGRSVLGGALQIVEDIVRANVWKDLPNAGQEENVEIGTLKFFSDGWDKVCFRVENPLQQLPELILGDRRLQFKNLIPDIPLFQNLDRQIVQIDLQDMNPTLTEPIDELPPDPFHLDRLFGPERADKEGDFIAEPLHVEKALA